MRVRGLRFGRAARERLLQGAGALVILLTITGVGGCAVEESTLPETVWVHGGPPDGPFEDDPFVQAVRAKEYWQNMAWNTGRFDLPEYVKLTRDGDFALDDEGTYINLYKGKEDERGVFIGPRTFLPVAVTPTDTLPGKSAIVTMCTFGDVGNMIRADGSGSNLTELAEGKYPESSWLPASAISQEIILHEDGAIEQLGATRPTDYSDYPCDQSLIPIGLYEPRPVHPYAKDD